MEALPPKHRSCMRKPMFRLGEIEATLGYWDSDRHLICISKKLAMERSWGDIRDVLLHEMAHQLADQMAIAKKRTEPPHGEVFREACKLLRADPRASTRRLPLSRRIFDPAASGADPLAEKVRKLLALSGSENRHEARVALAKARRLVERHHLPFPEHHRRPEFVSLFVGEPALRHPREDYHLASILLQYYFVEGVWVPAFVVNRAKMGRVLEISGTPSNVRIASYVHDCVRRHLLSKWQQYRVRHRNAHFRRTDFAVGLIEGFRETLEGRPAQTAQRGSDALPVPAKNPALDEYLAERYPQTIRVHKRTLSVDESVWAEGLRQGRRLVIRKGVEAEGNKGKVLPHNRCG